MVQRENGMPVFYRPDGSCVEIAPAAHRVDDDDSPWRPTAWHLFVTGLAIGPYTAMARGDHTAVDMNWAIDVLRSELKNESR
jgi:hypothetical protein